MADLSLSEAAAEIHRLRGGSRNFRDRDVLSHLVQPCDRGMEWVEGDNNYVWYYFIGQVFRPRKILEIGTRYGYSLKSLLLGSGGPYDDVSVVVYDDERDDDVEPLKVAEAHLRGMGVPDVTLHRLDTQKLDRLFPFDADLVSVDGDHSEDGVVHDLGLVVFTIGRRGGIIVVDDTQPGCVRKGCERFCRDRGLEFVHLPSLRGIHLVAVPPNS